MICVDCTGELRVIDSRPTTDGAIRRRRRCESCGHRTTTYELDFGEDKDGDYRVRFGPNNTGGGTSISITRLMRVNVPELVVEGDPKVKPLYIRAQVEHGKARLRLGGTNKEIIILGDGVDVFPPEGNNGES